MENNILPISKSECRKLDVVMEGIMKKYHCHTRVINFDNDTILIEVQYGFDPTILKKDFKINRHNMDIIEKVETQ